MFALIHLAYNSNVGEYNTHIIGVSYTTETLELAKSDVVAGPYDMLEIKKVKVL